MPTAISEKQVLEIWEDSLQGRRDLLTEDNESVRVIYPGRRNDGRGADLKDAVITTGRRQLKGDIEIHVKSSSWWAHGHHRDPAYNRVILHVVYRNDREKAAELQSGASAPTLTLCNYIEADSQPTPLPAIPCRNIFYRGDTGFIGKILDKAGEQRFLARAAIFQVEFSAGEAGQLLYREIMTALGYSKNKKAMAELAGRLPVKRLEATSEAIPDSEYLARCQALLIGTAGLLPSQRGWCFPAYEQTEDWETTLEYIWADSGAKAGMSAADWCFFKVRPGNHPVRRLAAMSYLLLRYRQNGLQAGLKEALQSAVLDKAFHSLEQALLVAPDDYWGRYLDLGAAALGPAPALLGKGRASAIIINVLLPFAYAAGTPAQKEKAMLVYRKCNAPAENALVTHMRKQLGISKPFIATARRQQGLIHIYKTFCSQGRRVECPLNHERR
ncbi:MAG: DUF2851 family protein [Dehalococcoidales bacterium]|nr:DUF2851 family protein [Dehalococcoidales bacterium]